MNKIILGYKSSQTISIRQNLHFQNISYPDNERDLDLERDRAAGDLDGDLAGGERCEDLPLGDLLHTERVSIG